MGIAELLELGGLFLVCFVTPTLSFFFPIRPTILTIILAQHLPWPVVGVVAGAGGVAGVLPLYGIAYKATDLRAIQRWLQHRWIAWLVNRLRRRLFLLVVLLVVTPLPDQLIGITAGVERYSFRRFLAANVLGRMLVYLPLAYAAAHYRVELTSVWSWILQVLTI